MIAWEWKRQTVVPDDMLDAARSIPETRHRSFLDLVEDWTKPSTYLKWAKAALSRSGDDCWDSAAGWAKRAVCRQMDGILKHNHLGCFLGRNYKVKSEYLAKLNVPGLNILRHTVIDPRNGIEHEYALATKDQAHQAVEVAELFLLATDAVNETTAMINAAIINLGCEHEFGRPYPPIRVDNKNIPKFVLTKGHDPRLVVSGYPEQPEIMVLYPKDEVLSTCPLSSFDCDQVLALNDILRRRRHTTGTYTMTRVSMEFMAAMKEQLKL